MRINRVILAICIIMLLAAGALSGCSSAGAAAADIQPVNVNINGQQGIWVTGQGKVTIVPDIAHLYLGIMTQAAKVSDAQSQASAAMAQLMTALTSDGIDKKDITTSSFSIQQLTRYDNNSQQSTITGYQVTNMLDVKIRALDKADTIINDAVTAGGDLIRINGINFSVENPEQLYAQAREQAIKDAATKAEDIASLAGVTLGKAIYISESASSPSTYPVRMYAAGLSVPEATPSPYISPGQTEIDLYVQVNYAIE